MTVIVVWMSSRRLSSFANAVRDAANDPNIMSFSMDIRRYMPGFGRVGAIPVADSADGAKVPLDGDGIAVDNSIDSVASSESVPENAIVSDVAATKAASTGSNTLICDNCKQREIDDAPKKCSHVVNVKWCSYCDEALWQTNAIAADVAATNAVSSGSETLICVNCKQREIGNAAKKCGFSDWCSFCDESLWQTNPDVICIGSSTAAIIAPITSSSLSTPLLALPSEAESAAPAKRKRKVKADCSSDSDKENVPPVPSKRNRKVVVSSDDDVNPFQGEAEESEAEESEADESDGDEADASDGEDADARTERRRSAVSEACAALRNRRSFKAARNTCPLCADLRVVLTHLLGLE